MASTTGQMSVVGGKFVLDHTLTQQTGTVIDFNTTDQFIDKEIRLQLTARPATAELTLTGNTTQSPTWGTATSGYYYPTNNISANLNVSTAGWVETSGYNESDSIGIGKVSQSIMQQGTSTIASGSTIVPTDSNQTITITEGYNAARTLVIGAADSGAAGEITSGSATISSLSYAYDSSTSKFNITGSADVSAPTINIPGYISSTKGTKNANTGGAVVTTTVDAIQLAARLADGSAATTRKPTLTKQTISITGVTDAASGASTSTAPTSGVYVAVRSNSNIDNAAFIPEVLKSGYGTTSNFVSSQNLVAVGAAQSDIYYIPITTTTPTVSGRTVSYTDGWVSAGSTSVDLGTVKSGNVSTLTYGTPIYDSTNDNFTVAITGTVPAPTVSTAGYVSSSEGTKQTGAVEATQTLNKVEVGASYTGTLKVTPAISRTAKPGSDTWTDAASGAVTTTKPTSGAYVRVDAAAKSSNVNITGTVTTAGYGTTSNYNTATATVLSVGSNAATATYVPIKVGTIQSGSATTSITDSLLEYDSNQGNFSATVTTTIAAPSITNEGYVSDSIGTKNTNTATTNVALRKITIQGTISGALTQKPLIGKHSDTNIAQAGTATKTKPGSGNYYIAVASSAVTGTVRPSAQVNMSGYGGNDAGEYTVATGNQYTYGAAASDVMYIPISQATFANSATSGTTYTDISSTAPVLISGDYLYINPGYVPASKISLAKLVPDAEGANAPANYILSGYTAFDNNGALITGTMATYAGAYTITTT